MPDFEYLLCDLTQFSDKEIKGVVTLKTTLLILKHIFSEDLTDRLPGILELLSDLLNKRSGIEYLETILRYVASGSDQINAENIKSVVRKIAGGKGDEIMPTLAEQWIEQGIQQGMQQGIQQGMQQGIQQGLKEAIEDVIELKFGSRGLKFLPRIEQVNEQSILKAIKVIIKSSESLEEAEGLIGELING